MVGSFTEGESAAQHTGRATPQFLASSSQDPSSKLAQEPRNQFLQPDKMPESCFWKETPYLP